jgi:glycosyltransferase involved in cell wall biosynthesis
MEQSALLLIDELKLLGHEVELLSLNEMGALKPILVQHGIPASAVGYRGKWGWRSFLPLRHTLRAKQADALVMVGHNLMAILALGNLCSQKRVLSLHFHHEGVKAKWVWRLIYRVALWRFQRIVYPSRFIMKEALDIAPALASARIAVSYPIPLPAQISPDRETRRSISFCQNYGIVPHHKVVGNAGWLIARKRWDVFLKVAAEVAVVIPEARFLIAGDGPERARLEQLAVELRIKNRVIWLGWQNNLRDFYQTLDVMLFNSDWDATGRAPLEAMSYGVPVVASMLHGGLEEILDSNEYGFLTDTHDVPFLAGKVIELLNNKALAEKIGMKARARIKEIGSPRRHAERVLELLVGA